MSFMTFYTQDFMNMLSWDRLGNLSNEKTWGKRVFEFVIETVSSDANDNYFILFGCSFGEFCLVVAILTLERHF